MRSQGQSYPFFLQKNYRWTVSVAQGIFFYLFMAAFLPFGVSNYNPNHEYTLEFILMLSWFMLANIAIAAMMEVGLKPTFVKKTGWPQILGWNFSVIIVLGLTSYLLYNIMGNFHDWNLKSGLGFVWDCGKVLIFPQLGVFFFFRFKELQQQFQQIQIRSEKQPELLISLNGQGSNETLTLRLGDLCYLQAQDNYVSVHHLQDDQLNKTLIRASLTQLITQLAPDQLLRCHRSFAVNPYQITAVKGKVPIELKIAHVDQPIPVSKTYRNEVDHYLKQTGLGDN